MLKCVDLLCSRLRGKPRPRAAKAHPLTPKNLADRHSRPEERARDARCGCEIENWTGDSFIAASILSRMGSLTGTRYLSGEAFIACRIGGEREVGRRIGEINREAKSFQIASFTRLQGCDAETTHTATPL